MPLKQSSISTIFLRNSYLITFDISWPMIQEFPASRPHLTLMWLGNFSLWNQPYEGQIPIKFSLYSVVLPESFKKIGFAKKENNLREFKKINRWFRPNFNNLQRLNNNFNE